METFKRVLDITQIVIIIGLVIALLATKSCCDKKIKELSIPPEIKTVIETKYDTITRTIISYKPKLDTFYIKDTVFLPTYIRDTLNLDSQLVKLYNQLAEKYFTTKVYIDEINLDSLNLTIVDTVYENSIMSRQVDYKLLYPTKTIYKETLIKEKGFYGGIGVGVSMQGLNNLGVEFLYKTQGPLIYGLGAHVNTQFNPFISGRVFWKLKS
jgi:hypothetical protein